MEETTQPQPASETDNSRPNVRAKILCYMHLEIAMRYFKSFYREDEKDYEDRAKKIVDDAPTMKQKVKIKQQYTADLERLHKLHLRMIDVLGQGVSRYASELKAPEQQAAFENLITAATSISDDLPDLDLTKAVTLIKMLPQGHFDEMFKVMEDIEKSKQEAQSLDQAERSSEILDKLKEEGKA